MALSTSTNVYGRLPSKPVSHDIKNKSLKNIGIQFPIGATVGAYVRKSSSLDLIKQNLRQLLLTERGERIMLPLFGTNLKKYLMEPLDETLLNQIKTEILDSVNRYARNVDVLKLQVFPGNDPTLNGGHHILIKLYCRLVEEADVSFEVKVEIN